MVTTYYIYDGDENNDDSDASIGEVMKALEEGGKIVCQIDRKNCSFIMIDQK